MSPRPFYEVKPTHYLLNKSETPEEKVRQWVLFELISTYSVHINNIEVEKPVKVGTRTHRADIVVYQDHIPYVIIECKKQDDRKLEQGLEQAVSYANCLGAKFSVYTNGQIWQVKRFLNSSWEIVTDIPAFNNDSSTKNLDDFANHHTKMMSILYLMYNTPISIKYSFDVYKLLFEFFMDHYWYTNSEKDYYLCKSANKFFRIAMLSYQVEYSQEEREIKIKDERIDEESRHSYNNFLTYCQMIGFSGIGTNGPKFMIKKGNISFHTRMTAFSQDLSTLTIQCQHLSNLEINIVKLMKLVMDHLWEKWSLNQQIVIPESVMLQFLKIASPICENYFGITLPEKEDNGS